MMCTLASKFVVLAGALAALALASGCGQKQVAHAPDQSAHAPSLPSTSAPPPQTAHAPTSRPFSGPGVQLAYGGDWHATDTADYALVIVPEGAGKSSDASVTVEIPKLPPHVPGLIPLGSVVNGYIDDIKKQHTDAQVEKPEAMKIAGVNARRVVSTWKADGKAVSEDAVLAIHSDHVYIFRANADEANRDRAKAELDALLQSVQWR